MRLSFDDFELDQDRFELRRAGQSVALEPQAFDVLAYLATHRERVVPKEELLEAVWESSFVSDSALTTRIKEVRQALGDDGRAQRYVRTVRGRGYYFVGEATESPEADPASGVTLEQANAAAESSNARSPHAVPLPTDSYVGRVRELAALRGIADRAAGGSGGVAVLAGEPGIGKTRIAQELAEYATETGMRALWGRVRQASGAPPYYPWLQVAGQYARAVDLRTLGLGANVAELTRLFPNLTELIPGLEAPATDEGAGAQFRMFEAYAAFLRAAAEREPLLVILEDLHWADEPTLALLRHLGSELSAMPLLVVATYRDTDIDDAHPLTLALAQLNREAGFERLHLDGLSEAEVGEYVRRYTSVAIERPLVEAVHERTEGNPFFVSQLVELIGVDGEAAVALPTGVREALTARLDRLSDAAHAAMRVAAVCGRSFDLGTLDAVLDGAAGAALDLVEEALAAHIIEELEEAGRYRFVHALMQETLLDQLSSARRARAHGAVAEALEESYRDRARTEAARLSDHFAESAQVSPDHRGRAAYSSELAARQASAQSAWSEAITYYERCLDLAEAAPELELDVAQIRLALGRCQLYQNDARPAWRNLLTALDEFRAREDWESASAAVRAATDVLAPPPRLAELLTTVLEEGGSRLGAGVRADLQLRRAFARFRSNEPVERWRGDIEEAESLLDGVEQPLLLARLERVRGALERLETGDSQHERFLESARLFDEAGDAESAGEAMWQAVNEPKRVGDVQLLDDTVERHLDYARRNGLRRWAHVGQYFKVRLAVLRGDASAAMPMLDRDMPGESHLSGVARAAVAELGSWPPKDLDPLLSRPELAGGDPFQTLCAWGSRLRIHLLLGDREAALEDEAACQELLRGRSAAEPSSGLFLMAGDLVAEMTDEAFVAEAGDWLAEHDRDFAGDTGTFANARGRIALRLGELDSARAHLEQAVIDAERAGWPVDLGRAHQALAELAVRERDEERATHHRAEAARRFEAHGAQVFLHQLATTEA